MADRTQARNANAPDYRVTVDGSVITPHVRGVLSRLDLTDNRGGDADELSLTINDDGRIALPRKGATIAIALGWRATGLVDRGSYTVDEIEWAGDPDQIQIRARSANFRETLPNRRTRSWDNITIGDIVLGIAAEHGLDGRVAGPLASRHIQHVDQTDESDINFLTRIAKRFDAIAAVKDQNLLFMPAGAAATVSGSAIAPVTIHRRDGNTPRYSSPDRQSHGGVVARWHDTKRARKREVLAGKRDNFKRLRETYPTEADAQAAANAEWARIQRGEQTFSFNLARGRPELYPETPIRAAGFRPEIDSTPWLLTRVGHSMSDTGYTNSLEMERRR